MTRRSGIVSRGYNPRIWQMWRSHEIMAMIKEEEIKNSTKKTERIWYWLMRDILTVDCLMKVDPDGWESWYDDDQNVPAEGTRRQRVQLVEKRIKELQPDKKLPVGKFYKGVIIWHEEADKTVGIFTYEKMIIHFPNIADAKSYVDGLPAKSIGYGYVL